MGRQNREHHRPGGRGGAPAPAPRGERGERGDWIYGRRPVLEVVKAGKRHLYEAVLPPGHDAPEVAELRGLLLARDVPFRALEREELDGLCEGGHHQGVAVRAGGFPYISMDQVLHDVKENPDALVLLFDHIEDPQNVGSLLRTADAAGVTAVLIPEDRAAGVTPAAVRASAGASDHLRVAKVENLVRAMQELTEAGVWITGLDRVPGAKPYTAVDFKGRAGLVVGSEGRGLSRLVGETCDFIASLPMKGRVASLNAGVAGAVALYEVVRQR
ncbi:MAG: 23S rRNA (guanosine(2251)-2'-O)-methyltransferase RlmB, partial [Verrucomicrobiota bacterium]|nr:23S rRNA (guanosine(2251)-2'-O)-methyltransferase RlmB [Verrucomicrobiota bacterium]